MLAHHRRPICLSLISTDLPIWYNFETAATLYQKDQERFHLLLSNPNLTPLETPSLPASQGSPQTTTQSTLLWLEISPYRVIMTMQGNSQIGYRHFWEEGVHGISRYWLHSQVVQENGAIRLRNFTRSLQLIGNSLPESLRLEYELWSDKVPLGNYVLNLDIHH